MAKFMNDNAPGIFVPLNLIDDLARAPKGQPLNKGSKIAGRVIAVLKKNSGFQGIRRHLFAFIS